jgi:hypothetical protein
MQIALDRKLGDPIGAHRLGEGRLGRRQGVLFPVDRSARRGEDDPFHPLSNSGLQKVEASQDIDVGVVFRITRGDRDTHLDRVMIDDVRTELCQDRRELDVTDVHPPEPHPGIQVFLRPGGEIVHHAHLVPGRQVSVRHVRPDESGATGR